MMVSCASVLALGCGDDGPGDHGSAQVTTDINSDPVVTSVVPSRARLDAGESLTFEVDAWDPDGDPLAFAWKADCDGVFDDPTAMEPSFTLHVPGDDGTCTLSVEVDDGRGGENQGAVRIDTGAAPTGGP